MHVRTNVEVLLELEAGLLALLNPLVVKAAQPVREAR